MRVIPTIVWGTTASFEFCFDGIEQGSVFAVSTYRRDHNERDFMTGCNKMLEALNPSAILCYGDPFPAMKGNIKAVSPYNQDELIKKLGLSEYLKGGRKLISVKLRRQNERFKTDNRPPS